LVGRKWSCVEWEWEWLEETVSAYKQEGSQGVAEAHDAAAAQRRLADLGK